MADKKNKMIYYVSNLGTNTIWIIDGDSHNLIKEVEIGPRPQNIIVDENKNVYIASDRNSRVTLINDLYDCDKTWYMPNNGNIQVDSIAQKIYVCNTEEICIYSLKTGEKISRIKGFFAAHDLKLNKDKRKLFVLDVLQNEIKVYGTSDFQLLKLYKDIGDTPKCIYVEENGEKIYIANKGRNAEHIFILNTESEDVLHIDLEKGSMITALEVNEIILYAANNGLHRIEIIDTLKRSCIGVIKTTLPEIQRLRLSPDKKILLAISQDSNGKGVVDKIDISNNVIIDTYKFEKDNIFPYDIGIVIQYEMEEKVSIIENFDDKLNQENGVEILARKIISAYEKNVIFSEVSIELSPECEGLIKIEEVIFKKCEIINETRKRQGLKKEKEYSIFQFDFYIPYCILYRDEEEERYIVEDIIKGKEEAKLYIPSYAEQQGVQFVVNSLAKVKNIPILIGRKLQMDIEVLISAKAVVDEIMFIPLYKNYAIRNRNKENEEETSKS